MTADPRTLSRELSGSASSEAVLEAYAQSVMNTFGPPKRVFVRGEGCYLWDADGRRYLDLLSGQRSMHLAVHGDYYGRDVNIASRVAARAAGGDVLVTRPVVERARDGLEFDRIAEVRLKGFTESTEVFIARERNGSHPPR